MAIPGRRPRRAHSPSTRHRMPTTTPRCSSAASPLQRSSRRQWITTKIGVGVEALRHRGPNGDGGSMNARRLIAALAVFAVVAAGLGITIGVILAGKQAAPVASQPAPPAPRMPTPAEFQIAVVVTDQDCTGPAGCVYKYRIDPKYVGRHPLPDNEIKVVYQVTGGHKPQLGDFTV